MENRLPLNTIVSVKGIEEHGFVLGYYNNVNYIVGWNKTPTVLDGFQQVDALALVVYQDTVNAV